MPRHPGLNLRKTNIIATDQQAADLTTMAVDLMALRQTTYAALFRRTRPT
jgi:hypothetical protein